MEASTVAAAEPAVRARPASRAWRALRPDAPFYAVVLAYLLIAHALHRAVGIPDRVTLGLSWRPLALWTGAYAVFAFVGILGLGLVRHGRPLTSPDTWRWAFGRLLDPVLLGRFAVVFLLLPPFMTAFMGFKASIPLVHPFSWDARLMELDRWLHFGVDPWLLLHPLLGEAAVTRFFDVVYYLWFPLLWMTVAWQAWHGGLYSGARSQFLLAFAASWILIGTLGGTLFASGGPVYFADLVGGSDPFAPLLGYLESAGGERRLLALQLQELLWQSYANPEQARLAQGISAMPSMHVAMATLMALVGFRVSRWLGLAYLAFAVLILVGSVHLAWHYAIDGYVAIPLAIGVWWLAGRTMSAWERRTGPETSGPVATGAA